MKRTIAFLSLFTSFGTLVCCAFPALFVALGFGAALAGLIGAIPQLIWLSENKIWLFSIGAVLLLAGGLLQFRVANQSCPTDPDLAEACETTRDWSKAVFLTSAIIYVVGAFFAFLAPRLF